MTDEYKEAVNKFFNNSFGNTKKEWQGLSDDEIGRLAVFDGLHHVEIPLLAKFIRAIEQALKEKNT